MPEEKLGYEAARTELIEVVRALEAGGTTLEESLALWERGEKLATLCQEWLDGARTRPSTTTREVRRSASSRESRAPPSLPTRRP